MPYRDPSISRPARKLPVLRRLLTAAVLIGSMLISGGIEASAAPTSGQVKLRAPQKRITHKKPTTKARPKPPVVSRRAPVALDPVIASSRPLEVTSPSDLDAAPAQLRPDGRVILTSIPKFKTSISGRLAGRTSSKDYVVYSLDPRLQMFTSELVARAASPHVAVVVMNPYTGRVLAIAEKSVSIKDLALHTGFPAASIFKLVTAAAAVEKASVSPNSLIAFRGGTYTLDRWNYLPNPRRDNRSMSLAEALGRSCNPVFARVALSHLNPVVLREYANSFGFNSDLGFDSLLPKSVAQIPQDDTYELGRTAAGFGAVTLSPIHAAALVSGIANGGVLPRPVLIDRVMDDQGRVIYHANPTGLRQMISPATSARLLEMMEKTTTVGTSRREFARQKGGVLSRIPVAAKTGTLRGDNPKGINHWFLAAAPIDRPRVAVAVISVNPTRLSGKSSYLGRRVLEKFFEKEP